MSKAIATMTFQLRLLTRAIVLLISFRTPIHLQLWKCFSEFLVYYGHRLGKIETLIFCTQADNIWCAKGDLNPHDFTHWHLKPACLPIPPSARLNN